MQEKNVFKSVSQPIGKNLYNILLLGWLKFV